MTTQIDTLNSSSSAPAVGQVDQRYAVGSTKIHLGTVWTAAVCGAARNGANAFSTVLDPSMATCPECRGVAQGGR